MSDVEGDKNKVCSCFFIEHVRLPGQLEAWTHKFNMDNGLGVEDIWHWTKTPGVVYCGVSTPNLCSTTLPGRVNCGKCVVEERKTAKIFTVGELRKALEGVDDNVFVSIETEIISGSEFKTVTGKLLGVRKLIGYRGVLGDSAVLVADSVPPRVRRI